MFPKASVKRLLLIRDLQGVSKEDCFPFSIKIFLGVCFPHPLLSKGGEAFYGFVSARKRYHKSDCSGATLSIFWPSSLLMHLSSARYAAFILHVMVLLFVILDEIAISLRVCLIPFA